MRGNTSCWKHARENTKKKHRSAPSTHPHVNSSASQRGCHSGGTALSQQVWGCGSGVTQQNKCDKKEPTSPARLEILMIHRLGGYEYVTYIRGACACMPICMYIYRAHICVHVCICIWMHVRMFARMCRCIWLFIVLDICSLT